MPYSLFSCWDVNCFSILVFVQLYSVAATVQRAPWGFVAQKVHLQGAGQRCSYQVKPEATLQILLLSITSPAGKVTAQVPSAQVYASFRLSKTQLWLYLSPCLFMAKIFAVVPITQMAGLELGISTSKVSCRLPAWSDSPLGEALKLYWK